MVNPRGLFEMTQHYIGDRAAPELFVIRRLSHRQHRHRGESADSLGDTPDG